MSRQDFYHRSVLVPEVIEGLAPGKNEIAVDATAGAGGHLELLADMVGPGGKLIGIDWDPQAVGNLKRKFAAFANVRIVEGNFGKLGTILDELGIEAVNRILFDLGPASFQFDDPRYGLSFKEDAPLDMRISELTSGLTANIIVNRYSVPRLQKILQDYGQERFAGSIARAIERQRTIRSIRRTLELAEIVRKAIPKSFQTTKIDPATKTFMAIRMVVNREKENLCAGLRSATERITPGGRIAVISFHSGEDRIVKHWFRDQPSLEVITRKPIVPTSVEIVENPRSRSAKLRIAQKIKEQNAYS